MIIVSVLERQKCEPAVEIETHKFYDTKSASIYVFKVIRDGILGFNKQDLLFSIEDNGTLPEYESITSRE